MVYRPLPRLFVNLLMLSFIPMSMLNKITGNVLHEMMGLVIVLCIATHAFFNLNWFNAFFKQKSTSFQRIFNTIVIVLLLCSFGTLLLSSMMISKSLFSFLGFKSTLMLRQIHTTSAYWFFILCFLHLGIQWQRFSALFKKYKLRVKHAHLIKTLLAIGVVAYAGCVFVQRDITSKLLMTFAFEFWDNSQSLGSVVIDYMSMAIALIVLTRYVLLFQKKMKITLQN